MINDTPTGRLRTRLQSNFDVRRFASSQDDDTLITLAAPERSPTSCERYKREELQLVHESDAESVQLIHDEVAMLAYWRRRLREVKSKRDALYERHRKALRDEWQRLLAKFPRTAVFYTKTYTTAWRKVKWKKIPFGFRTIRRRVYLKARPRVCYRWVVRPDFTRYKHRYLNPAFRPYVLRELKVPRFLKQVVRPAGFRRVVIRTKHERKTYDWARIRPAYVAFKVAAEAHLSDELTALDREKSDLIAHIRVQVQQPHRLVTCSTTGYIPPSWSEYYYQYHQASGSYDKVYQHLPFPNSMTLIASHWKVIGGKTSLVFCPFLSPGYSRLAGSQSEALQFMADRERGHEPTLFNVAILDLEAPGMLHPKTVVGRLIMLDKSSDESDEPLEQLAASTVRSLRKGSDYAFNLPRSIGELKDLPETFQQAREFLRWFAGGFRTRRQLGPAGQAAFDTIVRRTHSAALALVGGFLAWKFAIQPTIQDCLTVRDKSKEWLLAARRALRETISNLSSASTNVLHIRSKFRGNDYLRDMTLRIKDSGMVTVEATVPVRYKLPAPTIVSSGQPANSYLFSELERWCPPGHSVLEESAAIDGYVNPGSLYMNATASAEVTVGGDADPISFGSSTGSISTTGTGVPTSQAALFPLDEVKAELEKRIRYPRAEVPGYLQNQVSGVCFARYQIGDLLAFLQEDGLIPDLRALESRVTKMLGWDAALDETFNGSFDYSSRPETSQSSGLGSLLASVDCLYVAWQLAPLSFIYDWFTNSESIATQLNNFMTEYFRPPPPPLDGIWVTKRCELLAGRPGLSIYQSKCTTYVSDWYCWRLRHGERPKYGPTQYSEWSYLVNPARFSNTLRFDYLPDEEIQLARSGLYAAKRGEHIVGGWETFLPQVEVKLSLSKVGTLLGVLAGFIRPRAQA